MKKLNVECLCGKSVMGHFAQIEEQASDLKALLIESGVPASELETEPRILCDYCGEEKDATEVHTSSGFDQAICADCLEHFA